MRAHGHGVTHTGHVRPANEDAFHVGRWAFAVADGVGGGPAGEVASRIAVERIAGLDEVSPADAQDAQDRLVTATRDAATAIGEHLASQPADRGMATTLTAAGLWDGQLVLAHVGDSRAYLLTADGLERLTRDHTPVEEAVDAGQLAPQLAGRHPQRHLLLRVLGADPGLEVSQWPARPLEPGDRLLLCSDGLTEVCEDEDLAQLLADRSAEDATEELVKAALDRGAPDNVTVVVVDTSS